MTEQNQSNTNKSSKPIDTEFDISIFGIALSGLALSAIVVAPLVKPLENAKSPQPFYWYYGGIIVMSLLTASLLSIPSFKKKPYPNIAGLLSLMLNVVSLTFGAYILIAFQASH